MVGSFRVWAGMEQGKPVSSSLRPRLSSHLYQASRKSSRTQLDYISNLGLHVSYPGRNSKVLTVTLGACAAVIYFTVMMAITPYRQCFGLTSMSSLSRRHSHAWTSCARRCS